jgi:hypothetical protein
MPYLSCSRCSATLTGRRSIPRESSVHGAQPRWWRLATYGRRWWAAAATGSLSWAADVAAADAQRTGSGGGA